MSQTFDQLWQVQQLPKKMLDEFPQATAEHAICDAYRRIALYFQKLGYDKKEIDNQLQKIIYEKNKKFAELFSKGSTEGI